MATAGQPVLILKEGSTRSRGSDARVNNIMAGKIVAEVLRTTLGPRGMDKMLVSSLGDITITNDGATILKEADIQHPTAKILVEVAKTQDREVGDGTKTVVVLAGELLKKAEDLLDQGIHATIVCSGYLKAREEASRVLQELAVRVDLEDLKLLKKIAMTSMSSKSVTAKDRFAEIAVEAVKQTSEKRGDRMLADIDQVQVTKKAGKGLFETQIIRGVVIDKEVAHAGMPKRIDSARIALLVSPLEIEKTEISAEIRVKSPDMMKAFLGEEEAMFKRMVDTVKKAGVNVVFCQKGIDDVVQFLLAREGILAVKQVKESDMEKLSRATGGSVVTVLDDLKPEDLGWAEFVEERRIEESKMVFVEGCKNPKSVAILVRGGLERMVDEADRALHDALSVVADVVRENRIVAGGGAVEAEVARRLKSYGAKTGGREQLAIEAYAEALERIPTILAENAGLDPIDILVSLRAAHEKPSGQWMGVNLADGKIVDMMGRDVIEPLSVKEQALRAGTEAACMILRIDDVIAAAKPSFGVPKG